MLRSSRPSSGFLCLKQSFKDKRVPKLELRHEEKTFRK
jgi:hypothetical protein